MKFLADIHTHTVASGHAYSTLDQNAKYASQIGLKLLAMTDHAPGMAHTTSRSFFSNFRALPNELYGVTILKGAELNIMDYNGKVDLENELIQNMDLCIASLHPPCIASGTKQENTSAILGAMENPYVDILGHPGDPRYEIDVDAVFQGAVATNTLLEINNASLAPAGFRKGSDIIISQLLKLAKKHDVPIVLGSDAHFYTQIGNFAYIMKLLEDLDFPEDLILNTSPEKLKAARKHSRV